MYNNIDEHMGKLRFSFSNIKVHCIVQKEEDGLSLYILHNMTVM